MSDTAVRRQYQEWANPKLNKNAPAMKLGPHGFIRIYRQDASWVAHAPDYSTGVMQIRFCRVVVPDGQPPLAQRMTEAIRYELVDRIPLWERVTTNYLGVIVTEYPGPEAEGAGPIPVHPGSEHSCGL